MEANMYDAFIAEKYEDKKKGGEKARFTRVGVAFDSDKGGFDLKLPEGISVSGSVYIRPRKERQDGPEPGHDFIG
jgi:hypothetical protein